MPLPTIPSGNVNSGLATGYDVANSVRFNDGDSAYMHITRGSAGNQRTFTISMWIKRCELGSSNYFFTVGPDGDTNFVMYFDSNDQLEVWEYKSSYQFRLKPKYKFRDIAAWYHLCVAFDTTQSTSTNRVKIYVNGTQLTDFDTSSYPSEDYDTLMNDDRKYWLGKYTSLSLYYDGYLAEVVVLDGTAASPTSFGEFDSNSPNVWKPIDVSGLTFGTNGFYLDFEDSSNLGNDANGGTDWTEVNLAATDQSTDTCTNNFAVCNSTDSFSTGGTFSDGNMITQSTTSNRGIFTATMGVSTGKWYWEIKTSASGGTHASDEWNYIGIANQIGASNTDNILATSGTDSNKVYEYAIHGHDGDFYNNGDQGTYAASFTTGDIIGVFLDLDNNKIYWSKNGSWADGSGNSDEADPNGYKSVTDPASTPGGFYFPAWGDGGSNMNKTWQLNFGGTPSFSISSANADPNGYGSFEYPTEGGYALCTKNLAEFG